MSDVDVGAIVDGLRHRPDGAGGLAALLPENQPLHAGRTSAEMTRLRGYVLAAFADTGLPDAALPYVVEALESGIDAEEVAGAAIGLRGLATPPSDVFAAVVRAIERLAGADATVSFECYRPVWPFTRPTSALVELVRTLGEFPERTAGLLPELRRVVGQGDRFGVPVLTELRRVLDRLATVGETSPDPGRTPCCGRAVRPEPSAPAATIVLQDQDGRHVAFDEFFRGAPGVVAFFYTRCDNPNKCAATVAGLVRLREVLRERDGPVRIAAITYDPDFDLPGRLRAYGVARGVVFDEDMRFLRATEGFAALRERFDLGVSYGGPTVARHRVELAVLDAEGRIAVAFRRIRWAVDDVVAALDAVRVTPPAGPTPRTAS